MADYLNGFKNSADSNSSSCRLFIAILYHIWEARNKSLHDNVQYHPIQIIHKCQNLLKVLNKSRHIPLHHSAITRHSHRSVIKEVSLCDLATATSVLFYQYKNGGTLYTFALVMHLSSWESLHIWRNSEGWHKLQFLFWCIREFMLKHTSSGFVTARGHLISRLVVEKKGYAILLNNSNSSAGPISIAPILQDLRILIPQVTHKNFGGKLGRNILRKILNFLPYSYFSFADYVALSF